MLSLFYVEILGRVTSGGGEDHAGDWRGSSEGSGITSLSTRSTRAKDWDGSTAVIAWRGVADLLLIKFGRKKMFQFSFSSSEVFCVFELVKGCRSW